MTGHNDISPLGQDNGKREKLSEEKLMAYLDGQLSPAEQHEVELWLAEEGMESDALEGLQELKPEDTRQTVNRLNHKLRSTLHNKRRRRKPLKNDHMTWIAIGVILVLIVLAYIVVRKSILK